MADVKNRDTGRRKGANKGVKVVIAHTQDEDRAIDQNIFTADQPYRVVSVEEVHSVAGTGGGSVGLWVHKCTGTDTPSGGNALTTSAFNLKLAANTVQTQATRALTATEADLKLADGDRLAIYATGTRTNLKGLVVVVVLVPAAAAGYDVDNKRSWISEV